MQLTTQQKIDIIFAQYICPADEYPALLASGDMVATILTEALESWDNLSDDEGFDDRPLAVLGSVITYLIHDLIAVIAK